jgi:hypothetical protein
MRATDARDGEERERSRDAPSVSRQRLHLCDPLSTANVDAGEDDEFAVFTPYTFSEQRVSDL